jgi:peroxiredoxin
MDQHSQASRRIAPRPLPLTLLLAGALALAGCGGARGVGDAPPGEPLPSFRLASLDGRQLGPSDFQGQVVLLDFWATWCVPCHAQARELAPLYAEMKHQGVEFLAIDLGEDEATVRRFVADNPYPYPVLLDPGDTLMYELGIVALPTVMVLDREGKLVFNRTSVVPAEVLRQVLADAGA